MGRFEGKVVLVTGGNRNTGLDLVEKFMREGATVYMCGSSEESTASGIAALKARADEFGLAALVETHTEEEIRRAVALGADLIGVNCRDLRTFKTDPAITAELIGGIPPSCVRIAESGIRTHDDIVSLLAAGADGFLVGTTIMRAERPGAALSMLTGKGRRK